MNGMYEFRQATFDNIMGKWSWKPIVQHKFRGSRSISKSTPYAKTLSSALKYAENYKVSNEFPPVRVLKDGQIVAENSVDISEWVTRKQKEFGFSK